VQWPVGAKLRGTRYYDLLRQLAAQIKKKHIYIKLQQEMATKEQILKHAITQNYKHSAKLLHTADLM